MSKKIFRSIFAVAMIVLAASIVITNGFLFNYFNKAQISRLQEELQLASAGVEQAGATYLESFESDIFRFTLISSDGEVLYDSEVKSAGLENHIDREEIEQAIENGRGSSARYSSTLTQRTFYEAVKLENGNILRISTTQVTIGALIIGMTPAVCAIVLFSIITAILLSQRMTKSIVKPLEQLDLDNPESNCTYEELTPVLAKLNKQHWQIELQIAELKQKADEFKQITASMKEGLVLLDKDGVILNINPAAQKLFHTDDTVEGNDFLLVDRSVNMSHKIKEANSGSRKEFREQRDGREYQFMISPIESGEKIIGTVILCIDVTESAFAERNRKEFTANVSHELKTPLQSIIGSAELLESGLVKQEDTQRFVGNIKTEATRLVALINDIIRLSQLDEETTLPTESVNLFEIAKEVVAELKASAAKKQVSIILDGESCVLNGVKRYLYEIMYNLCDNAIRYNKVGGEVEICVKNENDKIVLRVSDTGIGIPIEHQSRIFERFYRVDKSHSKETGGTGLGLSIVKHAAACNSGSVTLDSVVDKGTSVTVSFDTSE